MLHSFKDQIRIEVKSLFSGYPNFVYSNNHNSNIDGIPVFVFHSMEPNSFEKQLIYLKQNGYKTLSIYEFYNAITKGFDPKNEKLVLLTIDDARSSVWRFAFPLLKKYKMHATVFVIPGITEEGNSTNINLNDYWNSKKSLEEINAADPNDDKLCNWKEIKEMYNSGFVNIESHTLFHKEVFTSTKIMDFVSPEDPFILYNYKGSPYFSTDKIGKLISHEGYTGLPLFESAPIMFGGPRMNVLPEFKEKCKEIFNNSDGNRNIWQSEIKKIVADESNRNKYFSFKSSSREDLEHDLKTARDIIQEKLDGNAGNQLCLPWTKGNEITIEVCKELNIKSCFWGLLENKKINKPNDDPFYITRLKNDFILRLPGKGRKSLFSIYGDKIKRRFSSEKVF